MQVHIQSGALEAVETPLLAVSLFEEPIEQSEVSARLNALLDGRLAQLQREGEVTGAAGELTLLHLVPGAGLQARRVALVGLGRRDELDLEAARVAAALVARKAREIRADRFTLVLPDGAGDAIPPDELCRVQVEAAILALYRYELFKHTTKADASRDVWSFSMLVPEPALAQRLEPVVERARATCDAVVRARDLSVGPGNYVTPSYLAEQAQQVARERGLACTVLGRDELREGGMHGILAVNAGSAQPPVLVAMRYTAPEASRTLAVVGKGITFDSGGISLKPAEHMHYMKHDMSGAAAVIGFLDLAAATRLPVNVLGVFAATENLPSGSAYKPGDVFTAYNGTTMEIVNTDAEGRVILADALAYAAEQQPDAIVDLATLTGACSVALGDHATGLFSNDQRLADLLREAGERSGDRVWQLPLWRVYHRQIESRTADIKNSGGRRAGAITAAHFLQEFVGGVPWAHLDIAGTAYADDDQKYVAPYNPPIGATGVGVRLLWHFAQAWKDA